MFRIFEQESHSPRPNGEHMSLEGRDRESLNGDRLDKAGGSGGVKPSTERPPSRSGSSSSRSTPSLKTKDVIAFHFALICTLL